MTEILNNEDARIVAVKMWDGAVLKRHHADVPITVLCVSGSGIFKAGSDLEEQRLLEPGVLLSLPASIEHEVAPTPELVIVVTKYKQELPTPGEE
jgi:quercetin dioxygenase-like cupin family protein